jgi:hypothetical protein
MNGDAESKELKFAPTGEIDRYKHLLPDFLVDIFDFEPEDADYVFVSDRSSLWDFNTHGQGAKANKAEIALWQARIEEKYGADVSDIESGNPVKIFERISG